MCKNGPVLLCWKPQIFSCLIYTLWLPLFLKLLKFDIRCIKQLPKIHASWIVLICVTLGYYRYNGVWLPSPSHKRHCDFHLTLRSLSFVLSDEPAAMLWETLWRGWPRRKELRGTSDQSVGKWSWQQAQKGVHPQLNLKVLCDTLTVAQ